MPKQNTENKAAEQDAKAAAGDDFDRDLERDNKHHSIRSPAVDPATRDEGVTPEESEPPRNG